jgi:hypothetical protein
MDVLGMLDRPKAKKPPALLLVPTVGLLRMRMTKGARDGDKGSVVIADIVVLVAGPVTAVAVPT